MTFAAGASIISRSSDGGKTRNISATCDNSNRHSSSHTRRGGAMWSASMTDVASQLHSVSGEGRNVKSCMKVSTLEDSIRSCEQKRNILMQLKGVKYSARNLLTPSPSKNKLSKGGASRRDMLRGISSPRWPSSRRHDGDGNGDDESGPEGVRSDPPIAQTPRKVRFGTLRSRGYRILAGANPAVSRGGPALELGWEYDDFDAVNVDEFESTRTPRRTLKEIKLSRAERESRLLESGVTMREIRKSMKKVNLARAERSKTLETLNSGGEKNEELKESIKYNFRRIMRLEKSESKKEDELWDDANRDSLVVSLGH